jgi:pilus assembly protein CpaB
VKTILQNIEVLSAGTDIQKDAEGKPQQVQVVNLLVTPEDAELLSLASNQTRIQLVLRNPLDMQIANPPGTVMARLFGDDKLPPKVKPTVLTRVAAAPKHEAAKVFVVEVFNGAKRTEEKFSSSEEKQ